MPRQDVPYPGAGRCSLRCEIANLWNALKTKLHSINGVQGDGNGDVKILAGQNVQIVNDQVHGEITISATGGSAEDVVKSVNGELPDQDGAVTVDTGVMTVNGVSPDADGEVTITAGSNITITPDADTNSIEISASGGTLEAVAPIYIDNDGKINLEEWELVTSTDWSQYMDGNECATEDLLISIYKYNTFGDDAMIPKGAHLPHFSANSASGWQSYTGIIAMTLFSYVDFFRYNNPSQSYYLVRLGFSVAGSGINQKMNYNIDRTSESIVKQTTATNTDGIRLYVRRH